MSDSEQKKYNGWTNYETWNYALWLDNTQADQEYWSERAREAWDAAEADGTFSRKENAAFALRDELKDEAESFVEEASLNASWISDAVNAYVSEVNWYEIAEHFLSDVEEEEEEATE